MAGKALKASGKKVLKISRDGVAALIGVGAFCWFKIDKGGKAKASKKVVPDYDEEDEPEFDDLDDAVKPETDDSDE